MRETIDIIKLQQANDAARMVWQGTFKAVKEALKGQQEAWDAYEKTWDALRKALVSK